MLFYIKKIIYTKNKNAKRTKNIKYLKNFLSNDLNCDVDLLDFSYAMNVFDKFQMETIWNSKHFSK